ncbi:MAG: hypothetical protein DRI71_06710 [Bacteroidetes bacterium]|nr:MAG: hypothetical protein DRI71_06710 [Bacteroidota bacterium]
MNGFLKYIVPLAFMTLAIYYLIIANWIEGFLYLSVSIAFPLMWSIRDGRVKTNLKLWNTVSWVLVIIALLLFLTLLRLDARV